MSKKTDNVDMKKRLDHEREHTHHERVDSTERRRFMVHTRGGEERVITGESVVSPPDPTLFDKLFGGCISRDDT